MLRAYEVYIHVQEISGPATKKKKPVLRTLLCTSITTPCKGPNTSPTIKAGRKIVQYLPRVHTFFINVLFPALLPALLASDRCSQNLGLRDPPPSIGPLAVSLFTYDLPSDSRSIWYLCGRCVIFSWLFGARRTTGI